MKTFHAIQLRLNERGHPIDIDIARLIFQYKAFGHRLSLSRRAEEHLDQMPSSVQPAAAFIFP